MWIFTKHGFFSAVCARQGGTSEPLERCGAACSSSVNASPTPSMAPGIKTSCAVNGQWSVHSHRERLLTLCPFGKRA